VIVLFSGDGQPTEFGLEGFYGKVRNALVFGLKVEIWLWRRGLSQIFITKLKETVPQAAENLSYFFLDQ